MRNTENGRHPEHRAYEIRIKGRVSDSFKIAFAEFTVTVKPVETVLHSTDLDQAALYSVLDRIQALGFELIEIRQLPPSAADDT